MGPLVYARHLVSGPRLPFTAAYFGSISLTLYFAVGVSSVSRVSFADLSVPFPDSGFSRPAQDPYRLSRLASLQIYWVDRLRLSMQLLLHFK